MFTGIVEGIGNVLSVQAVTGGRRIVLDTSSLNSLLQDGASICVNGVCLTVTQPSQNQVAVDVIWQTLRKSNLENLKPGDRVNLERAMSADSRFDGHLVQGHVDAVATVSEVRSGSTEWMLWFACPPHIAPFIVPQGSVAINGVSLTIAASNENRFSVALIPTTLQQTNLGLLHVGHSVNIETDIIARTLWHQLQCITGGVATVPVSGSIAQRADDSKSVHSANLEQKLKQHGFQ